MFDADNHVIDPKTGFAVHKDTGHVIGLEQAPHPVLADRNTEWPKWVTPSESHVVRVKVAEDQPEIISVPGWEYYHVNRTDGAVTVLVNNEDEEKLALGEKAEAKPEDAPLVGDDATVRAVHSDVAAALAAQEAEALRLRQLAIAKIEAEEVARRTAEKVERENKDREAAEEIAKAQRERLNHALEAAPTTSPVKV